MDNASSVSSITPDNRCAEPAQSLSNPSGGFSMFSGGNLITLVHILSEITVFVAMGMWVRSRTNSLQKQVNDLRDLVEQQTDVINQHTEALQILMSRMNYGGVPQQPVTMAEPLIDPTEPVINRAPVEPPTDMLSFPGEDSPKSPPEPAVQRVAIITAEAPVSSPPVPRVEMLSPVIEEDESGSDSDKPSDAELDAELAAELEALT